MTFDALYDEGMALDVEAFWGAGFLAGRYVEDEPSWTWADVVRPMLADARNLLDMGTGDGGVLAGLAPLPLVTVAYEEWLPTVDTAVATLRPVGAHVVVVLGSDENTAPARSRPGLPFADGAFDVVLNRHEAFDAGEVRRLTRAGGRFVTQQVGSDEATSVRSLLGLATNEPAWNASVAADQFAGAGWAIDDVREERPRVRFTDIAALIGYVRSTPWAFEDVTLASLMPRLRELHARALKEPLTAVSHRFLVAASRM